MCQAKIQFWGSKCVCLLPDYAIITSITVGKDGKTRVRTKTLCKEHSYRYKKNMRYDIKHLGKNITFTEIRIIAETSKIES